MTNFETLWNASLENVLLREFRKRCRSRGEVFIGNRSRWNWRSDEAWADSKLSSKAFKAEHRAGRAELRGAREGRHKDCRRPASLRSLVNLQNSADSAHSFISLTHRYSCNMILNHCRAILRSCVCVCAVNSKSRTLFQILCFSRSFSSWIPRR